MKETRTYTMGARAEAATATRERIVRVAGALFQAEPLEDVTLVRIARAAEVSHQTVLNHFRSKDGVMRAVAEVLGEETMAVRNAAEPGDVAGAVHALVEDYERMGDANFRWAATAERSTTIGELLEGARAQHQTWLAEVFGPLLPKGAARKRAVHGLHAATDVYTWKLLRRDLGLGRTETEKIMADLVVGALGGNR